MMKFIYYTFFPALLLAALSLSGEDNTLTFRKIVRDMDSWKNKNVVMDLRLKQVDYLFEKIVFYDSENIDIEFSFADKKKKKELAADLLNAHDGVLYHVSFTILGSGNLGGLIGDLKGFTPVFSDLIPQNEE